MNIFENHSSGQWFYFFGFLLFLTKVIGIEIYLWYNKKEYDWTYNGILSLFLVFGPGLRYDKYLKFDWWKIQPLIFCAIMFAFIYKGLLPLNPFFSYGLVLSLLGFHLIACIKDWKRKKKISDNMYQQAVHNNVDS